LKFTKKVNLLASCEALIFMVELLKIKDLTTVDAIPLTLRILPIILMPLTIFLPILSIHYTGTGVDGVLTLFSLRVSQDFKQGSSSDITSFYNSFFLDSVFLLLIIAILLTLLFMFIHKPRYAEVINACSLVFLSGLFIRYYLISELDRSTVSGISVHVTFGLGFFLIILTMILLFVSFFTTFDLKPITNEKQSLDQL